MRRWFTMPAVVLIAFVPVAAAPAAAQAGPTDPALMVKRQLRAGRGVEIAEISRLTFDKTTVRSRKNSRLQLSPSGPVAFDTTWQEIPDPELKNELESRGDDPSSDQFDPYYLTYVKGRLYISGGSYDRLLPEGKTWMGMALKEIPVDAVTEQTLDVFQPAVLRAVLKDSKGKPVSGGFFYQGTVTYAELYKASKSTYAREFRGLPVSEFGKRKIGWRLWTDGEGLIKRLMTKDTLGRRVMTTQLDTRYTGWGLRVVVTAPPADEVIDRKDLPKDTPGPGRWPASRTR
ncbi:hypothetical protein OG589_17155 [Sphaerisporangium sp. NBC_01403]|uniref:hypothetical protein n=1 Tax=Sphaerisporangium sp. NBC_01403 TaxID=2903599 RepID=UPI0032510E08